MIDGRFELRGRLGGGGMGLVWRAWDLELHRDVALKEVRPPDPLLLEGDPDAARTLRERVLREARSLARLTHPNVVTIHHIITSAEFTHPWLVMEFVRGGSLQDRLERGPLTPEEAAALGRGLLSALRAAHGEGIMHRDVKPANVLLRPDGTPVLTDFGIAALQEYATLTATGDLIGSPEYIAPERIRGREGDPSSDLWSLGMLLYVSVEGQHPLRRGTALATLAAVLDEPIPAPRRAGTLHGVLEALLERSPERRLDAVRLDQLLAEVAAGLQKIGGAADGTREDRAEQDGGARVGGPGSTVADVDPDADARKPANAAGWVDAVARTVTSRQRPAAGPDAAASPKGAAGTPGAGRRKPAPGEAARNVPRDAVPTGFGPPPPGPRGGSPGPTGRPGGPAKGGKEEWVRRRSRRRLVTALALGPLVTGVALLSFLMLPEGIGASSDADSSASESPTTAPVTNAPATKPSTPAAAEDAVAFKGPFYTERGAKEAVRVLRAATGGTKVLRASFHDTHISAQTPLADDPKRYDRISYHPSNDAEPSVSPGGMITGETVDISEVNWSALPGLWRRAEQELNVDKPKNRYLIVDRLLRSGPEVRLYLSDDYGGGYLAANADGKVIRVSPR